MVRKTKWHSKIGARALATAMSAAMGVSSLSAAMPGSMAYAKTDNEDADEILILDDSNADESEIEISEESSIEAETLEDSFMSESASDDNDDTEVADYDVEETSPVILYADGRSFDDSKVDAWDFGAEDLGENYNNRLDVETINGFYPGVEGGSTGNTIASFSVDDGDFVFNDGGYPTTHRLRTTNTALTRKDEKSLKDSDGNVYSGYLYSNKGSTDEVYVAVECKADDIITAYVASNGNDSLVHFQNTKDATDDATVLHTLGSGTVTKAVFYPAQTSQYKLFSSTEKLVVARVLREHAQYGEVSGTVEGFDSTGSFDLVFTNVQNGNVVKATVADGKYSAKLAEGFDYNISLEGADEYVITSESKANIATDTQMNFTIAKIALVDVSGSIKGIAEKDVADFVSAADFKFIPQDETSVYVPEIKLSQSEDGIRYELRLQKDVNYDVVVADKEDTPTESYAAVEDYNLVTKELKVSKDSDDVNIEFEAKPVYKVTIVPSGATVADLAEAVFKFTRLDPENDFTADGYVYEFTGTEGIALRDGQYDVEVSNSGAYVQKLTSNLIVKGADVTKDIAFSSDITEWNFSDPAFAAKFAGVASGTYNGLSWTNGKSHNGVYLYSGAGTISVPVKGACQIQVTANYQYSYYFADANEPSVDVKTGSTSQNDTFTYDYTGEAGSFDITVLGQSYITKIATVYQTPYKAELLVGSSEAADFATINEALDAVRLMNRKDGERVTVKIEPGNYEEMLVIDVPDVTLANASSTPTNTLRNKGVDIDENAVRVTWYYGHGYTYYSMDSDYKYDADVLAVNKANGYPSVINPGSGTGTYWNATVVVNASGFEAKNIIFENSFNQYMSQKAAEDVIVPQSGAKEGAVARAAMTAGDTTVQEKKYVERAAALALTGSAKESYFDGCRIIGRQDTLYGGENATAAFYNCAVYGGTDYIFGGMTAVFAKCALVFNTSEDGNDVGYITAAQQKKAENRGYLMYNCTVTSTTPGVDTASELTSKPGYFGRPWEANTSEVVFYNTVIEKTCEDYKSTSKSLIRPEGWNSTLSGESARNVEYGTFEVSAVDYSAERVSWVPVSTEAKTRDGKDISVATFLGDWDPFTANNNDMTVVFPEADPDPEEPSETTEFVFESKNLTAFGKGAKADGDSEKAGTENYFTILYSATSKVDASTKTWTDDYASEQRLNLGGAVAIDKNAVKFTTANPATVKVWWACGDANRQMAVLNGAGETVAVTAEEGVKNAAYISTIKLADAGSYYLGGTPGNNYIFKIVVSEEKAAEPVTYTVESSLLTAFAAKTKADGEAEKAGTDNYFTLIYSAKSKVDASTKTWDDGYASEQRINFGGKAETTKNSIKFTTSADGAAVKVWWAEGGDDNRQVAILDEKGEVAAKTEGTFTKNATYISTLTLAKAGTYYLGGYENNNYFFKVEVTDGAPVETPRTEWATVAAPVIKDVALDAANAGNISVTVNAVVGKDGGDKLSVTMFDSEGNEIKTLSSIAEKTEFVFTFTPDRSGDYTFVATLSRDDEEEAKDSEASNAFTFSLPLATPEFKNVVNKGKGKVTVKFYSVPEATSYVLTATDKTPVAEGETAPEPIKVTITKEVVLNDSTEYSYTFENTKKVKEALTVGHTYELSLYAVRTTGEGEAAKDEESKANTLEIAVIEDEETEWVFSAFGQGVAKGSNCGYTVNEDGSVTVWNTGNKGKLVPASTDGLAFYYTAVPTTKNFTLTAKATIDTWSFTNGQEGFGIMAADRVGVNGDASVFWNNSYMASGTKVEYFYDNAKHEVTNVDTASKITMKLGLGAQEKIGVTPANLGRLEANDTTAVKEEFSSKMYPLETSCGEKGTGTYNLFANDASGTAQGTIENPLTEVTLKIQRNNTGFFVSYLDEKGEVISTQKFYDRTALSQLDSDFIYVGFFAARTFKATFSDFELTVIDPKKDAPAEKRPTTYVDPNYQIISAEYSNTARYELKYTGNADGVLTVKDENGKAIINAASVKSGAVKSAIVNLAKGNNKFFVTFKPDANFHPGGDDYKKLSSYAKWEYTLNVNYASINENGNIYVSPNGKADAEGTENDPVDIYTAVKYVQPGQTISLAAGTYSLTSTVIIERGIDGTVSKPITMVAENGRAIFDFNEKCAGFILAGNYWYIKGIDCTKSGNSEKGIQVSGSHITLEDVRTYENGNTGIQVSRYLSSDKRADWPSYNLILNCTSYSNADAGYEDADGFAAKLTCGEGIVFDGCISYNNADDGWDLYAKVESGSIGQVTIQNCVAFNNGYGVDGKNEGNGNGFKMGGASMAGAHKLINSVAWGNKAKGIDSNSGPDIQVYNSMSFNNGSNNVALYTNDAANTNYVVDGVISFRTENKTTNENLKLKGTQEESKVYGKKNFYWIDGASSNSEGLKVSNDWFVSLDAPKASTADPYAVAAAMRTEDGRINLGNFLKLTDKAVKALEGAELVDSDVAAELDGTQTIIEDQSEISGSDNDSQQSVTEFTIDNLKSVMSYTGYALTQDVEVYYGANLLKEGTDYTVAYKNNTKVGTATITVTGKGNYSGKTVATFTIEAADIKDAAVVVDAVNETGTAKNPAVKATVSYMGKTLKAGTDYMVEADFAAEPEVKKVTTKVSGKDKEVEVKLYPVTVKAVTESAKANQVFNFKGENTSAKLAVYPKNAKAITENNYVSLKNGSIEFADGITSFDYTGVEIKPLVTVFAGKGNNKGEAIDPANYFVTYTKNINKGTGKVTVTGVDANGFTGTLTKTFSIKAVDMAKALEAKTLNVVVEESVEYVKGGAKAAVTVSYNDITLIEGVDYKLTYSNNNKIGQTGNKAPKVTIKGAGNFKKSVVKNFVITAKDINKTSVFTTDKATKKNAKGNYLKSNPVVYDESGKVLAANTDYTVKFFYGDEEITNKTALTDDNTTIKVVITGKNTYTGEVTATYQIREVKKLSAVKADKISDKAYTGKEVRADSEIKLYTLTGKGKNAVKSYLDEGKDFEIVLCYNNVNKGTATYVLRGTGSYTGYKTVTFKIKQAKAN